MDWLSRFYEGRPRVDGQSGGRDVGFWDELQPAPASGLSDAEREWARNLQLPAGPPLPPTVNPETHQSLNPEGLFANALQALVNVARGGGQGMVFDPRRTYDDVAASVGLEGPAQTAAAWGARLAEPGPMDLATLAPALAGRLAARFGDMVGTTNFARLVEPDDLTLYREAMQSLDTGPSSFVTHYSDEQLQEIVRDGGQIFLNPSGAGYMIVDGDLRGVFNAGDMRGIGSAAVTDAIRNGARTLDAFDALPGTSKINLPQYYGRFGFEEVDRIPWDDAYAPPGWDYDQYGRPDIVFMRWNPDKAPEGLR